MRRLDLNLLLVFSAVMRTGSAKLAADQLYIGPSAVSMALSRLRDHVGYPLFVRGRSGLQPTQTAEMLYARLEPALAAIGAAVAEGKSFDPATTRQTFRLGLVDDFEWWLLPRLQAQIRAAAPGALIVSRAVDFPAARAALDEGLVDVVITAHSLERAANLPSAQFLMEDFVVLAAKDSPLPAQLTMADYLATPHALVSVKGTLRGVIDAELERLGVQRFVAVSVQHFLTLPFLVADGGLIATMPRRPARILAERFALQVRELPFASPRFDIGMIWHGRTQANPASAWLRQQIEQAMRF
ncbi:LysR family transcriptional regulator [Labrys neptuniae]